jgi:hypothetical protein
MSNLERFEDLKGKVLTGIKNKDNEEIIFMLDSGEKYYLHHWQNCCEDVRVDDVNGNLDDLVGSPILLADETSNEDINPEGVEPPEHQDSFTWTL